ncbi:MAG TPA: site-2 protease family protein [Clostridiaceae bacterium]|nr:site-2 protease family protein [Clostridiaceae bacterium]
MMFNRSILDILIGIPGIVIGLAFHEFAHAFTADRLGDPTPRYQGRLTLSPLPHIDPIGFIMILLLGFGWAKPVQINTRYFKKPRRDEILVSLAGPVTNLLIAIVFATIIRLLFTSTLLFSMNVRTLSILYSMFDYVIRINIVLFLFNLMPLPPLDGFHVLSNIIPLRYYRFTYTLQKYSTIILILFIVTNISSYLIGRPAGLIYNTILRIFGI